jgi:hypothetical protein
MEGYDVVLIGSFFGFPAFNMKYGELQGFHGGHVVFFFDGSVGFCGGLEVCIARQGMTCRFGMEYFSSIQFCP